MFYQEYNNNNMILVMRILHTIYVTYQNPAGSPEVSTSYISLP